MSAKMLYHCFGISLSGRLMRFASLIDICSHPFFAGNPAGFILRISHFWGYAVMLGIGFPEDSAAGGQTLGTHALSMPQTQKSPLHKNAEGA
jgi:hypothetical protein